MKLRFLSRYFRAARTISKDEDGIVLIWATILMVAIIALAGLALDASRYRSLQTQMQAGADALALAGARELDGSNGSITRATNAINSMISNSTIGTGNDSTITAATITFYSCLSPADPNAPNPNCSGTIGTETTNSNAAKYVGVTVAPASVNAIFAPFSSLSTDAMAVAGYDFALCNMPPVFICNPYEQAGDTNETANNRWMTQVSLPANERQLMKLSVNGGSGYGPGHFGFLMPPSTDTSCNSPGGGSNGASSLSCWIAKVNPPACYTKKKVDLNTGQMQSVFDAFNVRFDMYGGNIKATADYAPATNVRKGYKPGKNACGATIVASSNTPLGLPLQINGSATNNNTTLNITSGGPIPAYATGFAISGPGLSPGTIIVSFTATTVTISPKASSAGSGIYKIAQQALGLPLDTNIIANPSLQLGNGQWDCQTYWQTVHGVSAAMPTDTALGGHCGTGADTTVSRFAVYQYENRTAGTVSPPLPAVLNNDYSGPNAPSALDQSGNAVAGETGAPTCNPPGLATDGGGGDRRTIYAAIINCMANASLMNQGGQTANNIPVAGFGKFFMTQPADVGNQTLYGEMTGAVGLDKNAKNNVQLYR